MRIIRCITNIDWTVAYPGGPVLHQFKYGNKNLESFTDEFACHLCTFPKGELEIKVIGRPYATLNVSSCFLSVN